MAAKAATMAAASTFMLRGGVSSQVAVGKTHGGEECHVARSSSCRLHAVRSWATGRTRRGALRAARRHSYDKRRQGSAVVKAQSVEVAEAENSAAGAGGDSVVAEVALLKDEGETDGVASKESSSGAQSAGQARKRSPLERGGTLKGTSAAGKDPGAAATGTAAIFANKGKFEDPRWRNGTWDVAKFTQNGKVDWDSVIDAEVVRRKWLEDNPEASTNEDPVYFDTSVIPWWAWVKRFHLPEAELLNGRAAMVGFAMAYLVDAATGVGLVDQMGNFFCKTLLLVAVVGVLGIRKISDIEVLKNLAEESTFYDKQWQATWKEGPPPSNSKKED
eukprot:TRINITY_DN423_c0_g1_i1.p1 TRINITY_DN423_c0_g1~~TRINITY_DN423_c0_g1_i1.p1  ORF type:complete len:332 (+),score=61.13 TRINITY_DN423_c0_g1_i1:389-1384(+)